MKKEYKSFAVILADFAALENDPKHDPVDYADALTDLATACARSVLKKVIDPKSKEKSTTDPTRYVLKDKLTDGGCNPLLMRMQADLARDQNDLARLVYASDRATDLVFDSVGDLVHETIDPDLASAAADLAHENLADGLDLVNDAVVAILDEVQKQRERDPHDPVDLERPYTVRRLKRKVWIKDADGVGGYETIETAPIREVYKAIRRAIQSSRAVQADPRNGYSYIEDLRMDGDGDPTVVYRRLPKYADLGGVACDFNGKETAYTTDGETVDRYYSTLAALNLTDRQNQILIYRLQGYGYKAIATRLGVSDKAIKKTVKQIQVKAENIGFTPDLWQDMTAEE